MTLSSLHLNPWSTLITVELSGENRRELVENITELNHNTGAKELSYNNAWVCVCVLRYIIMIVLLLYYCLKHPCTYVSLMDDYLVSAPGQTAVLSCSEKINKTFAILTCQMFLIIVIM